MMGGSVSVLPARIAEEASDEQLIQGLSSLFKSDQERLHRLIDTARKNASSAERKSTAFEMAVLHEHNMVRESPNEYAKTRVLPLLHQYKGKELHCISDRIIITREGTAAVEELLQVLRKQPPCAPLQLESGLTDAANERAASFLSSDNKHEKKLRECVEARGEWWGSLAENTSLGWKEAKQLVLHLLIDDGVDSRGHRLNILNPEAKFLGVSELIKNTFQAESCAIFIYTGGFGPPKIILQHPLQAEAIDHPTDDVHAILRSLPHGLQSLRRQILDILVPDNTTTRVYLDYRPTCLEVKFVSSTTAGTSTKTQTVTWTPVTVQ